MRVELFTDRLPPGADARWTSLSDALCLLFAVTATWLGYKYVQELALFGISFAHSNLPFPLWAAQSIIPDRLRRHEPAARAAARRHRPEKPVASARGGLSRWHSC